MNHFLRSVSLSLLTLTCGIGAFACGAPAPVRAPVSATDCAMLPNDGELAMLYTRPVLHVEPLHRYRPALDHHDLEGAAIKVAGTPARPEAFERALACHAARHDIAAITDVNKPADPLRPHRGEATVRVEHAGSYVVVKVTSADDGVARDILERALSLKAASPESGG